MLAATLLPAAGAAQTAQNLTRAVRSYAIPAGPLADALNRLADVSQLQLIYSGTVTRGRRSSGINGAFTPQQALAQLLAGSGLSYRVTSGNAVTIFDPTSSASTQLPPSDGSIVLDPIDVTAKRGDGFTSDTPYETPGSVSHISREQIDRVPPASAGDVFINTPGVIAAGNRIGTSINPNIRGLQGMERVKVTVDGAEQTTSSYRGYIGNRDETYVDPDMIGGIDITKGPSNGPSSGIGGTVAFRTLSADDLVKDGKTWGARLKGGLGNNTASPPTPSDQLGGIGDRIDRPSFFTGDTWSGNVAVATNTENFEGVAAFSKRNQGNYFVGTKVPDGLRFPGQPNANAIVFPGTEAFNTSENTESALLKGKLKWGDGQSLELGYLRYDSEYGEINELLFGPNWAHVQRPLSKTDVDTYTAKYRWNPSDNDLLNFRANLWLSNINTESVVYGNNQMRTTGGDLGNTSIFDSAFGKFTLDYGLAVAREHATAPQSADINYDFGDFVFGTSYGPSGVRTTASGYSSAKLDVTDWIALSAGLRYDQYTSNGEGYMAQYPEASGSRLSPNAGITLTPVKGVQFFGLYKEGFRAPTLRESYWNWQNLLVANPGLKPEISKNKEFGVNLLRDDVFVSGDKLRFKASYFDNHYDDYIFRDSVNGDGSQPYHFVNIDHANYKGFELSGSYDAGVWFTEAAFTKYLTIEYCPAGGRCYTPGSGGTNPLTHDYATNYIPPEYSGSVTAGVRLFEQKLTLGGRMHFAGVRFGYSWEYTNRFVGQVGNGGITWPSYRVFDVFASYKFTDDAILNVSIENITDEYYFGALASAGIPAPGRTARAALGFQF
ncbi:MULTISPECIES: TonB-dependent receptor [Bradyrhizobium]|uniref:TonB-dependent receptor n=1 Tax=Bradyrhizobium elkanii TaxID=29448 RepID=UPI000489C092|nr:TonB-dependent receptor [Bradyrhizobium elkanii]